MKTGLERRAFLGAGAALLASAGMRGVAAEGGGVSGELKFCLFADLHFMPGEFPHPTTEFLDKIIARAKAAKVDFILHLGDLMHRANDPRVRMFIDRYNRCGLPAYHTIGNHENDATSEAQTLAAYGLKSGHYHFDVKGFRFIICDCNYIRRANGKVEHYANSNYFGRAKDDLISWMPEEQIAWLAETIESAKGPCVICSHQSFDRERGSVPNWRAVRDVLETANSRHPGRVRLVMNGHHHCDYLRILNGIPYFDVNSANYIWFDEEHSSYPADYMKGLKQSSHTLTWKEPLSAIVTLGHNGHIRIEGSRSEWLYGISPEKAGLPLLDEVGRPNTAMIQSVDMTLGAV